MTQSAQHTANQINEAYDRLLHVFPSAASLIQSPAQTSVVNTELEAGTQIVQQSEKKTIFEKLRTIHNQPLASIDEQTRLYLEQQVSDLVGISVTTEIAGMVMPYLVGQVEALPHYKNSPNDTNEKIVQYPEAGLRQERSYFGWIDAVEYGVSLPLHELAEWETLPEKKRLHFFGKAVIVLNPVTEQAFLAKIIDIGPTHTQRYQIGLSPALIREGAFWSPGQQGLAAVFIVESNPAQKTTGPLVIQ